MPKVANFARMEPPDSSAARMPLPGARRVAAISSKDSGEAAAMISISLRVRVSLRVEFSRLARASFRLSSTVRP